MSMRDDQRLDISQAPEPGRNVNTTKATSGWRDTASIASAALIAAALVDATVETFIAQAPLRFVLLGGLILFALLHAVFWRATTWPRKAIASFFFLLIIISVTAWLPGGLDDGIVIARQPTSSVLMAITGLAVLFAGLSLALLRIPIWLRATVLVLTGYGVAAFVVGLMRGSSYAELFHGQSLWMRAPFWLRGTFVGIALLPLAVLVGTIAAVLARRLLPGASTWPGRWQLNLSLLILLLISPAAFLPHPAWLNHLAPANGKNSKNPRTLIFPDDKGGSKLEVTDFDIAADENGGAIESITGTADPSTTFYGPGFNGRRLIDDRAEPTWTGDPWTGNQQTNDPDDPPHPNVVPGIPLEIVLSFYRHQSALVGAVVIRPGKDLTRAPKDVEIWASNVSPSDGYKQVGSASLAADSNDHAVACSPVEAKYLKIRVLSNQQAGLDPTTGKPTLEISEIRVFEAKRTGYTSILDRNPELPNWKGSPRYAAQRGIEWLQPAAVAWQKQNNCFGCHSQAQAVMGLAVATKNNYIVSEATLKDLTKFTVDHQNQDGTFHSCCHDTATQFAAMELAYWDNLESAKRDLTFLKSVDWLLAQQQPSGEMPEDQHEGPIDQGSFMTTANSMVAFDQAFKETGDPRYKRALDAAMQWIASSKPETTQDEVFQILALSRFADTTQKPLIQERVEELIREEDPKGGWRELPNDPTRGPNAFATGQVLYAFKQAGVSISSSPFLKGVRHLLDTQDKTGAWRSHDSQTNRPSKFAPTMWAVIGLAGSFGQVTTTGLQITAETGAGPAARNLEIILDCSGSMKLPLGKSTRIATARQVLSDVLSGIPDDFNVGLRVYAQRYSSHDKQTCTDTELLVPIQKLDRQGILSVVNNLKPRGETPLVYSTLQSPADLKAVGGGSVIVITDGEETCGGNPLTAADQLKSAGIPITLNIVGFTLKGKKVEQQLTQFARSTGGQYYSAQDGETLSRALRIAALNKFPYQVFNDKDEEVAKGQAGPLSETLQPGTYKVVIEAGDQELTENVTLKAKTDTVLKLVRSGDQFVVEQEQRKAEEPVQQVAGVQQPRPSDRD